MIVGYLVALFSWSVFLWALGLSKVYRSPPFILASMQHASCKSKPDYSKPKSPPPLTVYYTNVRGVRGNFTDLEAFMLKNNPDIFALFETNLHDDQGARKRVPRVPAVPGKDRSSRQKALTAKNIHAYICICVPP